MTNVRFLCSNCGQPLCANDSLAGHEVRCSKCIGEIVVPQADQPTPPQIPEINTAQILGDCPYCRTEMSDADNIQNCPTCQTPHHEDCWDENKGCTVFGCEMAPPDEDKLTVQPSQVTPPPPDIVVGHINANPVQSRSGNSPVKAGQGQRLANYLLDGVFSTIFLYAIIFVVMTIVIAVDGDPDSAGVIIILIFLLYYPVYYLLFESILGRTPAKFITGTKVVTASGGRPTFEQIAERSLIRLIPIEVFSFFGNEKPTGWHDKWSGTRVVPNKSLRRSSPARADTSDAFKVMLPNRIQSGWIGEAMLREWLRIGKVTQSSLVYTPDAGEWQPLATALQLNRTMSPA